MSTSRSTRAGRPAARYKVGPMARPFGVYLHFPWCTHRCPYCDFAVTTEPQPGERRYARAVLAELALRAAASRLFSPTIIPS